MCVIAYYPTGLELDKIELENCFEVNKDGAGIMYYDQHKGLVKIEKGFMTWNDFWKAVQEVPVDTERVFHFRIATSGAVSKECCHPFPVCDDLDKMRVIRQYTRVGLAHNGVLYWCTPKDGLKSPYSDSMVFTQQVINQLDGGNGVFNQGVKTLIHQAASTSKFAIMRREETMLIGEFQQGTSGAMYSNDSWKGFRTYSYVGKGYNYKGYGSYSGYKEGSYEGYDWDEYDYTKIEDASYTIFFPLSEATDDDAEIIAYDLESEGIEVIEYNLKRYGVEFIVDQLPFEEKIANVKYHITRSPGSRWGKTKKAKKAKAAKAAAVKAAGTKVAALPSAKTIDAGDK